MECRLYFRYIFLFSLTVNGFIFASDTWDAYAKLSRAPYKVKHDSIILRSQEFHAGASSWKMIKDTEQLEGQTVSALNFDVKSAYNAIVPGTVLNTLINNNVYPEPYYGLNNARESHLIPDITEVGSDFYTYWFRTEFQLPDSFDSKQVMMRFDGINYRAEVWLNGHRMGDMAGMFNRGYFNITDVVNRNGKNALAVLVKPVDIHGGFENKFKEARAVGENRNGGDGTIGKNVTMLMSVGWDFTFSDGIRDRNTGIWKDIVIYPVDSVELRDPFIKSKLSMPDMKACRQDITVEVINHTDRQQSAIIKAVIEEMNVNIQQHVSLAPNEKKLVKFTPDKYDALVYADPKLWWPINKGPQNLYELKMTCKVNGVVSDTEKARFAVRDVVSDRNTPDKSRQFYVNGKKIFLHGTNWIPEAMLRKTDERMYTELRYTRQAGINFIRFWGGGIAESDYFFDLCDELGIMVSMEFWLSGDTELPSDRDLYRANFADTIKMIRNHPSLIYYISANERDTDTVVPVDDLVAQLDGTRGYQAASEIDGIHDGSPYKYVNPMFYYDDTASERGSRINGMCPEYGTSCLPMLDCLQEMMDEKDIWPVNKLVWDYHDGGGFHDIVTKYVPAMQQYGAIDSAEDMAWKGQMVGAVGYRSIWECWNYNRLDCGDRFTSGVWFWYNNSPVRQVCGRMWDWSLEPTAALYYSQDAHEPIHAQYDFLKNTVSVNNEYYIPFKGAVSIRIFNLDMSIQYQRTIPVCIEPDRIANDVVRVDLPDSLTSVHFIRLDVKDDNGKDVADTFYWRSTDQYKGNPTYTGPLYAGFEDIEKLDLVKLESHVTKIAGKYTVKLKNPSDKLAFMVRVKLTDAKTSKPIRPTFYADNFFCMIPGEEKEVQIEPYNTSISTKMFIEGWNVKKQRLTIDEGT